MSVSILRSKSACKRKFKTGFALLVKPFSILLLLTCVLSLSTFAQGFTTVDFHQAENDKGGNKTYNISWVNGILNATHTDYFEGIGVPQRIVFTGILPKSSGAQATRNTHSMIFQVLAEKANKHAYDFPISWEQAFETAARIGNGSVNELPHLLPGPGTEQCGDAFSAPGKAVCDALSLSIPAAQIARPAFPDLIGNPGKPALGAPNVNTNIACFEGPAGSPNYGNRTLEIRGNQAISNASITFDGYKGSGLDYAQYTITWTSTSDQLMIRFATRLSPGAGQCGYGSGQGAGSISGGPYHVVLNTLDGVSLGSQDNQIMSNAIQIPPNCAINAPADACAGAGNVTFSVTPLTGETYTWSITNVSGAAPTPLSGTGTSFVVNVGGTAGTFDVNLTVTSPAGVTSCSVPYRVYDPVVTNAGPDQPVCASSPAVTLAGSVSGGATTGTWSGGTGTFNPNNTTLNAVYTPSAAEITAGTVTLTLTSAEPAGPCEATSDNMTITIKANPTLDLSITQPSLCGNSPYGSLQVCSPKAGYTYELYLSGNTVTATSSKTPVLGESVIFGNIAAGTDPQIKVISSAADGSCPNLFSCNTASTTACVTPNAVARTRGTTQTEATVAPEKGKPSVLAAPNPFNDRIRFMLKSPVSGQGTLELYNIMGQKVKTVFQGNVNANQAQTIEYAVPGSQRSTLIYIFRVGNEQITGKLIGLKQ